MADAGMEAKSEAAPEDVPDEESESEEEVGDCHICGCRKFKPNRYKPGYCTKCHHRVDLPAVEHSAGRCDSALSIVAPRPPFRRPNTASVSFVLRGRSQHNPVMRAKKGDQRYRPLNFPTLMSRRCERSTHAQSLARAAFAPTLAVPVRGRDETAGASSLRQACSQRLRA